MTRAFKHVLANSLAASLINATIWFAITFWVYLETRSVFATSLIAGSFLVGNTATGIWFGSLVDHHRKKSVMQVANAIGAGLYSVAFAIYLLAPDDAFHEASSPWLWVLILVSMSGVITGNLRGITLPTLVTLLIPEDDRDRANGMVGTVNGVAFLVTSVISGVLVAWTDMWGPYTLGISVLILSVLHLQTIDLAEPEIIHVEHGPGGRIDLRGTLRVIMAVPGLLALIFFGTINNFLAGVYMALMDPYGLELISVEAWGFLWGLLSAGFIIGGLMIAKFGLGNNPLRTLFLINIVGWTMTAIFPLRSSIVLLTICMAVYMIFVPYAEASEQTILQRVVPYERQGRVFGLANSVEQAASPVTAFLVGPLTQFVTIPLMTDGKGADWIGSWFGTGEARGIALVFVGAGVIGLIMTLIAFASRYYRQLSTAYRESKQRSTEEVPPEAITAIM